MRRCAATVGVLGAMFASQAGAAQAGPAIKLCAPVRVNQVLSADPKGIFGAFHVTATGVSCALGRAEASTYIHHPRAVEHQHATVGGWSCTVTQLNVAQRVHVRCTRPDAAVTFDDEIPSG